MTGHPDAVARVNDAWMMRCLIKQYVPIGTTLVELRQRQRYELPLHFCDNEVENIFYTNLFHEESFIMKDGKWAPNWDHVMQVKDVLGPYGGEVALMELEKYHRAELHDINALFAALRRADSGKMEQCRAEASPQVKALNAVLSAFRHKNNKDLSADGGDTYAELTVKSIDNLLEGLRQTIGIGDNDIFVDGGCGYNFMMAYVAQVTGCKVYGIEYVSTKVYMGMMSALRALEANELTNYKIGYIPWDMYLLESLGPATIAIFFDEAFPRSLLEHICRVLVKPSTTLRAAVFFKPSKQRDLTKLIEYWGDLQHVRTIKGLKKFGSHEGNTAYLFIPSPNHNEGQKLMAAAGQGLTEAVMMSAYLAPAWSDDPHICLKHYAKEVQKAEVNLPQRGKKNRQVTCSNCMAGIWKKCTTSCAKCAHIFKHCDDRDFSVKNSMIDGQGLFTNHRIVKGGIMLLEYQGAIIAKTALSASKCDHAYTMCLDANRYVQADQGIHMWVNHSCQPNCRLLKWMDIDGRERLSISSLNGIHKNAELTVDYGAAPCRHLFQNQCLCSECTKGPLKRSPEGESSSKQKAQHVVHPERKRRKASEKRQKG
jgi:SAM-dependent methyltransferase